MIIFVGLFLHSCFTGVEYTPKIKAPTAKEASLVEAPLLGNMHPQPPKIWEVGKQFYVTDSKISLSMAHAPAGLGGKCIEFAGLDSVEAVDGSMSTVLFFKTPSSEMMAYKVAFSPDSVAKMCDLAIPFTIELSQIQEAEKTLLGENFTVMTRQWRDSVGNLIHGRKFVPVTVQAVLPGTVSQPVMVRFTDDKSNHGYLYLTSQSRMLSKTNPLDRVDGLKPEIRQLIIDGKLSQGMTTQEARLALGQPANLDRLPTYNGVVEVWSYENGVYLRFVDGLLEEFRQ